MSLSLRVTDATVRSGDRTRLDAVSVDIQPGRVHALIGANGSGKSTLLTVIAGELGVASGRVEIIDKDDRREPGRITPRVMLPVCGHFLLRKPPSLSPIRFQMSSGGADSHGAVNLSSAMMNPSSPRRFLPTTSSTYSIDASPNSPAGSAHVFISPVFWHSGHRYSCLMRPTRHWILRDRHIWMRQCNAAESRGMRSCSSVTT